MSTRNALLVAGALLLLIVATVVGFRLGKGRRRGASEPGEVTELQRQIETEGPSVSGQLFFPGPGGLLYVERRELPVADDLLAQIDLLLAALLEGPASADPYPALPGEISIGWVHLSPESVLYVDLVLSGERSFPAWGSKHETLAIYSVVNTVLANAPEVDSVVVLRNGQQRQTFAGHLDTTRPLLADLRLVGNPTSVQGTGNETSQQ